jgi:hypothetical protein
VAKVGNGVWLSFPMEFVDGSPLTLVWRDRSGRELRRYEMTSVSRGMLSADINEWTSYVPLDES